MVPQDSNDALLVAYLSSITQGYHHIAEVGAIATLLCRPLVTAPQMLDKFTLAHERSSTTRARWF